MEVMIVTGVGGKYALAKQALKEFGLGAKQIDLDVDEIQSEDMDRIALEKARAAYRVFLACHA